MPRYGWFPDGYFVHHDLGTLENLLNRTTFPGAHGTRPGVDHQAGVAELFRLIAVTAGIAEDDAWDLGAMFLTNELDGILCMNDIEMMYFDQQQRRYVYNGVCRCPPRSGASARLTLRTGYCRLFAAPEWRLYTPVLPTGAQPVWLGP